LRTEPDGDQTPSTPGLPALIAEATAAGALAELAEDGDPALASPVVGRTVYRIAREALTNVRKHAPGATVLVRIGYRQSQVRVVVSNGPATLKRGQRAERHRIRPWPGRPAPAHRADGTARCGPGQRRTAGSG